MVAVQKIILSYNGCNIENYYFTMVAIQKIILSYNGCNIENYFKLQWLQYRKLFVDISIGSSVKSVQGNVSSIELIIIIGNTFTHNHCIFYSLIDSYILEYQVRIRQSKDSFFYIFYIPRIHISVSFSHKTVLF